MSYKLHKMTRNIIIKNEHVLYATLTTSYPDTNYTLDNVQIQIHKYEYANKINFKIHYKIVELNELDYCSFYITFHNDPNFELENDTISFNMYNNMNDDNNQTYFTHLNKYHGILKFKISTNSMNRFLTWCDKNNIN